MKKLILIISLIVLGIQLKAQSPVIATFALVRDSICVGDSCVYFIYSDTLPNKAYIDNIFNTFTVDQINDTTIDMDDPLSPSYLNVNISSFSNSYIDLYAEKADDATITELYMDRLGFRVSGTPDIFGGEGGLWNHYISSDVSDQYLYFLETSNSVSDLGVRFDARDAFRTFYISHNASGDASTTAKLELDEDFFDITLKNTLTMHVDTGEMTLNFNPTISSNPQHSFTADSANHPLVNIDSRFIRFNNSEGVHEFETSQPDVIWQGPLEDLTEVFNNTGATIPNGRPVYYTGSNGDTISTVALAASSVDSMINNYAGITTQEILNNSWGFITTRGYVRDIPADFTNDTIYVGDSILIDTIPPYPNRIVIAGRLIKSDPTNGLIYAYTSQAFDYKLLSKDYNFTSQGIATGSYYRAGFYRAAAASVTLTQASTTQTYGSANVLYSSHPFVVCGGVGTTDAGVIGLRVTGTSINDDGIEIATDADTIISDITSTALNAYFEAKKFVGQVTFQLITISGSPTTYSLTFNYGTAKYDDINNRNFYIAGFECVGLAGANDTGFDIELLKHQETGWTYSAGSFIPGSGTIAKLSDDIATKNNLGNGLPFAYKRSNLNEYVNGSNIEGYLIRITTTANNSVQTMDLHVEIATQN